MSEMYAEAGVKCSPTPVTMLKKVGYVVAAVLAVLLVPFFPQLFIFVAAAIIMAVIWMYPKLTYEFEYVFCDGQLDFDKILGNSKRKRMMRIDFDSLEVGAYEGDDALTDWKNQKCIEKDYTSYRKEITPYIILVRQGQNLVRIKFEPTEKMLTCMKNKSPRKIHNK